MSPTHNFTCDTCAASEHVFASVIDGPPADGARCVQSTDCGGVMRRQWQAPSIGRGSSGGTPARTSTNG